MASSKMEVQLNLLWAQYEKGLAEAEKATQTRTSRMEQIFRKAGKSYTNAITSAAVGLVGANALDAMMRNLGEELKNLDLSKLHDMSQVFGKIGSLLENALKQIPILGGAYELGHGIASAMNLGGTRDAEEQARKSAEHLEEMRKLGEAQKAVEEQRAKAAQQYSDFSKNTAHSLELQLRLLNASNEEERIAIQRQEEFNRIRERALELMKQSNMPIWEQLDALRLIKEQFDKISERQRQIREDAKKQADAENRQREIEQAAEQARRAKEQAQREAQRILEEAQREQERLTRERASAESDRLEELARIQSASNVVGLGTAVGSVRVAGAVDYSSERMATNLERIRDIETRIEENTRKLKDAQRAA